MTQSKERELRFVSWSDGRLSIMKRRYERDYDTKVVNLTQSIDIDTYSLEEVDELRKELNEVRE